MSNSLLAEALQECEIALGKPERWFFSCTMLSNLLADKHEDQLAYLWKSLARQTQVNVPTYHVLAGVIYAHLEEWQAAIEQNKKAIALDEKLAIAYSNLAELYKRLGETKISSEYHYQFLSIQPDASEAEECEELGISLLKEGQPSQAVDCYRWAIKKNPEQWTAYYRLAHLLTLAKQPERAIRYYQLLLERDPSQGEAHQKIGKLLLNQHNYNEAVEQFQQAIRQQPDFVWHYLGLVKGLMPLKRWDEAIETCQAALQLQSNLDWAYRRMGVAWIGKGKQAEAISCFQQVAALSNWPQCLEQDYHFTYDRFTYWIPAWEHHLNGLENGAEQQISERKSGLNVLQIGDAQGMWSCWMLDQVLTQAEDQLQCITSQPLPLFQQNLAKVKTAATTSCETGEITDLLQAFHPNRLAAYQLIYFQGPCPIGKQLYHQAKLAWPLLSEGGLMVFEDYHWVTPLESQQQSPRAAIDRFLEEIPGEFEILDQAQQLFFRRIRVTD